MLAAEGLLFGGAAQDRTGSSGSEPPETKVEQVGEDEYLVSCRRYYSTGSVYADYLILSVTLGDAPRTVLIESGRPGVELPDDWDGFGQRLTGSGSIVLDRVRITGADAIERPVVDKDQPRYPFTFNQVHLTTVVAGIANRALLDAVELVRSRTRNYYHGTAGQVQDEPVIQAVIGVASAKAFAATATISAAAALLLGHVNLRSGRPPPSTAAAPGPVGHLSLFGTQGGRTCLPGLRPSTRPENPLAGIPAANPQGQGGPRRLRPGSRLDSIRLAGGQLGWGTMRMYGRGAFHPSG